MRSFLPFAALLGVVLVLGCQDVGTGPDGLVPQFDKPSDDNPNCKVPDAKGHCHSDEVVVEDATFEGTFTVDVIGVAGPLSGRHSGKQNIGGGGATIELDLMLDNLCRWA